MSLRMSKKATKDLHGQERPRIIIKKEKGRQGGHHGGAWKVAYADFVTAMMALFIVLWILGASDESLKAGIAQYFRDPGVFETSRGIIPNAAGDGLHIGPDSLPPLQSLQENLKEGLQTLEEYSAIKGQVSIKMTSDGLLIELTDKDQQAFFDLASAKVKPIMLRVLKIVVEELKGNPYRIAISGHTDARAYQNEAFYSNWELSSARALNTRRAMEELGFSSVRVERVVGYADRILLHPDNPLDPANRRINILVLKNQAKG